MSPESNHLPRWPPGDIFSGYLVEVQLWITALNALMVGHRMDCRQWNPIAFPTIPRARSFGLPMLPVNQQGNVSENAVRFRSVLGKLSHDLECMAP
jgi:hypothetical protein